MATDVHLRYTAPAAVLADRVILVTGAGRGIGRTAALTLAQHGATCVLLGRKVPDLESAYDEIVALGAPEPALYPMDLLGAEPAHYEELVERLEESFGHLDGLLINAGLLSTLCPLDQADPEEFSRVMQVNVTSAFLLAKTCVPLMRRSNDASVVFTTSDLGRTGRAFWGGYAVSKFAVEGLCQVLASEVRETSVRVNCINPGPTRTAMRATAFPGENPTTVTEPAAIMPSYLYLLGPDSRGVTGQSLDAQ
jgi:NAD(P)-dependent dehydrogenase (short-subunit alcohol dehydrogenase family)